MFVMHTTKQNKCSLIMRKTTTVILTSTVEEKHLMGKNVLTQNIVCSLAKTTVTSVCVQFVQKSRQLQVHINILTVLALYVKLPTTTGTYKLY